MATTREYYTVDANIRCQGVGDKSELSVTAAQETIQQAMLVKGGERERESERDSRVGWGCSRMYIAS